MFELQGNAMQSRSMDAKQMHSMRCLQIILKGGRQMCYMNIENHMVIDNDEDEQPEIDYDDYDESNVTEDFLTNDDAND
jgi:hypothetical protein